MEPATAILNNETEVIESEETISGATTWRIIIRRFRRNQAALVGLIIIGFFFLLAIISLIND